MNTVYMVDDTPGAALKAMWQIDQEGSISNEPYPILGIYRTKFLYSQ